MGDGDILPEEGDEISMLGNRNDSNRQSAIYISSYNSMDIDLKAPFIAHYKGINDFSLSTHRKSWWSLDSSTFTGDIKMGTAEIPVQDYINQQIGMSTIDLNTYKAYAKDAQGLDMTLLDMSDNPDYPYVGIAVTSKDISDLAEEDFVWMEKGQAGVDAMVYKLIPLYEYALV